MYSSLLSKDTRIKELNIFVGPNGSGKSTAMKAIKEKLNPESTMWIKDLKPLLQFDREAVSLKEDFPKEVKFLFFENPENGLYPETQSTLADLFVELINKSVCIFVETHSEYIIRRIQFLIANTSKNKFKDLPKITPEQVIIYQVDNIFEKDMIPTNYRTDGKLTNDFDIGFWDEGLNIASKIYDLINDGTSWEIELEKDGGLSRDFGKGFLDTSLDLMLLVRELRN
jgi:AAA15 family ATPase/GTPase